MKLADFYFAQDALFVIPVEALTAAGLSPSFAAALMRRRGIAPAWVRTFNTAYAAYYQRCATLYERAAASWFPPRAQNVCIVTAPHVTRPYFQVFPQASWLLYHSDFDAVAGSPEYAIYQFFHAERLGLCDTLVDAFAHNLGYFLLRSDDEVARFGEQAAVSCRPDAAAFRQLAALLEQRRGIYHATLRPPPPELSEPCGRIDAADLIVARSMQPALHSLAQAVNRTHAQVVQRYMNVQAKRTTAEAPVARLARWLAEQRPRVLLMVDGAVVWDADNPSDTTAVVRAAASLADGPAAALQQDLTIIDEHSRRFLALLREPQRLPRQQHFDHSGGVYIDEPRQLIVYDASAASLNRLVEATPPYQRWLLGARVMHEWGHLAVAAGWVAVALPLREEEKQARQDVALLLRRIVNEAPAPYADIARQEQAHFGGANVEPGEAWMQYLFSRMPDYQTNLLAQRLLYREQLESYLRVNVRCHAHDGIGPYQQLMRYAFEYQYLALSAIEQPLDYFLRSTWFEPLFVAAGIITLPRMQALWRAVARVCACQRIDESAFVNLPAPP